MGQKALRALRQSISVHRKAFSPNCSAGYWAIPATIGQGNYVSSKVEAIYWPEAIVEHLNTNGWNHSMYNSREDIQRQKFTISIDIQNEESF